MLLLIDLILLVALQLITNTITNIFITISYFINALNRTLLTNNCSNLTNNYIPIKPNYIIDFKT